MRKRLLTIWQVWQGIAERLRQRGALVSLVLLLSIGLFEPLACVIHCSVLEVLYTQTSGHHHHVAVDGGQWTVDGGNKQVQSAAPVCAENHSFAANTAANCDAPTPQPFHEMMLLSVFVLLPLALLARRARQSTGPPAEFFSPPLLRPPLLCV